MPAYHRTKSFSQQRLDQLRTELNSAVPPEEVVVCCGSYARREASESSDIDYFVIGSKPQPESSSWLGELENKIADIVPVAPSANRAFAQFVQLDDFLANIGGDDDSNRKITRRMLFLLEGEWLTNESKI
jgi:predicted nucleotidyltransferase